jgi:hypothetical protein
MIPFKKTLKLAGIFLGILNAKEIPIEDGKVTFSEGQQTTIKESMSEATMQAAIDAMNNEIAANEGVKNLEAKIQETLQELDTAKTGANAKKEKVPGEEDAGLSAEESLKQISTLTAKNETLIKEKDALIAKMMKNPEMDTPLHSIKNGKAQEMIKHSATHAFGTNKEYDKIEGRNWNQLLTGKTTSATDFTDQVNIQKLNGDATLYVRENPTALTSLHRDSIELPADWKRRFNVVDRIATGTISTAEITQSRQLNWAPKNNQDIQAEEGKIFPIKIDIEFVGYLLQEIEASWLAMYNKEGSQAAKMTFVRFLLQELDKRARVEDRIATIKGVYVETPKSANKPGAFINRQDGLLVLLWRARDIVKKYRPFSIGKPTTANIVDYIDKAIKSLPQNVRSQQGLAINLSEDWLRAYKSRYELIYGTNNDYKGYPTNPKDYNNIKFQQLTDLDGSDFMFITFPNNIEILENLPKEKSMYKFGSDGKRDIFIIADYKMGIRPVHIGTEVKEGDPDAFKVQTIWSNDLPLFPADFFAPVFDDTTGKIKATFNQLKVDDKWATEITDVSGLTPGVIFKLQGDTSLVATKNVVSSGNLDLASNFDLKTGGTLSLIVLADGSLKELSRTTAPVSVPTITEATFDADNIDAATGKEQTYVGNADVAITEILNGVQGQQIKIFGNATADADVTITTVGNIKTDTTAVLAVAADFVELVLLDGVWTEFNRNITV